MAFLCTSGERGLVIPKFSMLFYTNLVFLRTHLLYELFWNWISGCESQLLKIVKKYLLSILTKKVNLVFSTFFGIINNYPHYRFSKPSVQSPSKITIMLLRARCTLIWKSISKNLVKIKFGIWVVFNQE